MIVYNITVNIHEDVHDKWLQWAQNTYIPGLIQTGKFSKARMVKVLVDEQMGGITYSLQFETDSRETLEKFYEQDANHFEDQARSLFGELMLTFKTELEVIKEF
ncbi:DUF4286 family protein [Myroides sp. LJL119]